jgi:hypothetical protein
MKELDYFRKKMIYYFKNTKKFRYFFILNLRVKWPIWNELLPINKIMLRSRILNLIRLCNNIMKAIKKTKSSSISKIVLFELIDEVLEKKLSIA